MKHLAPWFVAIGAAVIAITSAIAGQRGAFTGKISLTPYLLAYGVAVVAFIVAGILFNRQGHDSKDRPNIIPIRFGYLSNAPHNAFTATEVLAGKQYLEQGLIFRNDGEPAYQIAIPAISKVGSSKLLFPGKLGRLDKSQGEAVLRTIIERAPHSFILSGLFDEMKDNNIDCVIVTIEYRGDSHTAWWATICDIERNVAVEGGLEIRRFEQKRIRKPSST